MSSSSSSDEWSHTRGLTLSNTTHTDVAPFLPLPSLPTFCGATDPELRFSEEQYPVMRPRLTRSQLADQASKIAELLRETDVSYLNHRDDVNPPPCDGGGLWSFLTKLFDAVRMPLSALVWEQKCSTVSDDHVVHNSEQILPQVLREIGESPSHSRVHVLVDDTPSRTPKNKRKNGRDMISGVSEPSKHKDAVLKHFSEVLEQFLDKSEVCNEDQDDVEWSPLAISDITMVIKEIMSIRVEKMLHLISVDMLLRLLKFLDRQIHHAEGLTIHDSEHSGSNFSLICGALESIHASLAVMAHSGLPKHLYKEETIERILEFTRHQIKDVILTNDSSNCYSHRPSESRVAGGEEEDECEHDYGSVSRKGATLELPASVNSVFQKLCTILGLFKDLLLIERLPDSCILQLIKTSLSILEVDNIQLLQLKAISLISVIFYSYTDHRTHIVDEVVSLLWKLPCSKRAIRTYHLPDEEQRQIQMITALLLQLVHHSANLPDALRTLGSSSHFFETTIDTNSLLKCHEAATESCVSFWTDLLTTLNLPEYPASGLILEVLCVLLLQNAGPKSKDISMRSTAIDILGTIAARLKHDAALCAKESFWIAHESTDNDVDDNLLRDTCCICLDAKIEKLLIACQSCQRLFHADCLGIRVHSVSARGWHCPICLSRKELLELQSYSKSHSRDSISKLEILQQILLNYLKGAGSADDVHLFAGWFYLCIWYKDNPNSRQNFRYRLAGLRSEGISHDLGASSLSLNRESIKRITSSFGQNSSFSRGFDTILSLLMVSLRENSPVIRAKALRAVSLIVEADPDGLCDAWVQSAVEGRFCDSAISVREAALELVGRYIASHPDVSLKYFEKVAERVKDTGVSVRKRAIRIIREMCISNANFPEFPRACIDIISRVGDEESSIQDLVCKTFYEFWFEEPSEIQAQYFGDGSLVPLEVAKN
ncbi:Sister chromatid cohesion protein SCC2-like protein [Drosera capensis]